MFLLLFKIKALKVSGNLYPTAGKSKKSLVFAFISFALCGGMFLFSSKGLYANPTPMIELQSPAVKAQTIKALQMIDQGRWELGRDTIAKTKDPLASKLYYWLVFTRKNEDQHFIHLTQFIRNNPEWPGARDLRSSAEKNMPLNLPLPAVVEWFDDYPPRTSDGMERYLDALIKQGKTAQAKGVLADWWAQTPLERKSQQNIYYKYKRFLGRDAHHKRLDMLLFAGQYDNARAVADVLGQGYPALAEARIALAQQKPTANALLARVPTSLRLDPGLMYERLRWRRRNDLDVGAMELLHSMPPADKIQNKSDWWRERHILVQRMVEKKMYESAYLLASEHVQSSGLPFAQAEFLSGWLALRFLDKAPQALQHFETLYQNVSTPVSQARAAYWAGRALEKMGDKELAQNWYKKAAQYQTVFYGQMAGAELGMEEALPHAAPPTLTAQDTAAFERDELMQAAHLLHEAGMRQTASLFIQAFTANNKTPKAYRYAAEEAARMKRYHDALRIAKNATRDGMFLTAQSYPVIADQLGGVPVEWALVHAIIRQESLFDMKAQSPAGALGYMQLMPGTASDTAKKLGMSYNKAWLTTRADYNIKLGSQYLEDMLERFDGSYPMAIAAYNAGPGRVDKWIETYGDPRLGQVDYIDWMEMIPIYETRNYVQRVLENVYVYRLRLKTIQAPPKTPLHVALVIR